MSGKLAVVALGGNALVRDAAHQSIPDQYDTVTDTVPAIVEMIAQGWDVVVTHGNGPQVGFILRRSELAAAEVAPVPLDYAVADTQGAIGYMFAKALTNELRSRGIDRPAVGLVTQTVVDPDDPAFARPTKPVGSFLNETTARRYAAELDWSIMQDGDRGWRRAVPSPEPTEIVELGTVRRLIRDGAVVVASGGGGVPVTRDADGRLAGVEAVIDKDRAAALLARTLDADLLAIPTGVPQVAIGFGTPDERWLDELSPTDAAAYAAQGQFGEGSMRPKVEAIVSFLAARPDAAGLITAPNRLADALAGRTGTWFTHTPEGKVARR